jgi:hypothetical protein
MKTKKSSKRINSLIKRATELVEQIEAVKPMYKELDELTDRLFSLGFVSGNGLSLVDNFESKNTAWKASAFRRFELKRSL